MSDDLLLRPAHALLALLKARKLSARELLDLTLARIARLDPQVNAFASLEPGLAAAMAAESDARIGRGDARPLEGLPVSIKDCFEVEGFHTSVGAPALKDFVSSEDASAVARLRRAGAVIFGKTNVPIFTGDFQTYDALHGTTNNPWDVSRSPGGSSGGAAAAVACGFAALELGSDLGGSIRWPAHSCGLFGLKTSWNLVSTWGTIPPPRDKRLARNADLVVAGPLARAAADLDLALDVIAGPRDPTGPETRLLPVRHNVPKGMRVALWLDEPFAPVDAPVAAGVAAAARTLAEAGAIVDAKARPAFSFAEAWEVFALLNHAIVAYSLPPRVRDRLAAAAAQFAPGDLTHRALQTKGARLRPGTYTEINARRQILRRKWARFFEQYDVVLCPPAPVLALPHDHSPDMHARRIVVNGAPKPYFDLMYWACLATGADLPAAVAPVGVGDAGLPRGVQIIGPAFADRSVVAVARMLEERLGGFKPPPLAQSAAA